jgi:hypothetical protein
MFAHGSQLTMLPRAAPIGNNYSPTAQQKSPENPGFSCCKKNVVETDRK